MNRTRRISAAVVAACALSHGGSAAVQTKPTKHHPLFVDGRVIRSSLSALRASSDVVALVTVAGSQPADSSVAGVTVPLVATVFTVTVLDVLRGDGRIAPGSSAAVWRLGGVRDKGEFVETTEEDDFRLFSVGDKYILFLKWVDGKNAYDVVGGPNGAFKVNGSKVIALGRSAVAQKQNGIGLSDFLQELR